MTKLARRSLELCVLFFAVYAFVFLPLGESTGLEHAKAVLSTPEAERAGRDLKTAGSRMLQELLDFDPGSYRGDPVLPKLDQLPQSLPKGELSFEAE